MTSGTCSLSVIARNKIPRFTRNRLRNLVADTPSPGGREIEGGGISPSPWPSPVKGEGISAEIATLPLHYVQGSGSPQ